MTPPPATVARCDRPVFIIGTERSGSNLLRLVLNSHSRLFIPHPPHIMHLMKRFEASYGDLRRHDRFRELVGDVCSLVRSHTFPWEVRLDPDEVVRECREPDLFSVYAAVHELYRRESGKARWGCKSTFMINETEKVLAAYPRARFIHLVRDPRDVSVSARNSVFNHFHPWFVARLWAEEQRKAIHLHETLAPGAITKLHYEDLVAEPEARIRALCTFLGEDFEPRMLGFFDTDEARKSASLCFDWRNTDQGFLRDNTRKFMRTLSRHEIAVVEAMAEPQMRWCGYPLVSAAEERLAAGRPSLWTMAGYAAAERLQKIRVELESLRRDRNHLLRVRKWLVLKWLAVKALFRPLWV